MSLIHKKLLWMAVRQGLIVLGTLMASRGVVSAEDWGPLSDELLRTLEQVVGLAMVAGSVYKAGKGKQRDVVVATVALETTPGALTVEQVERSVPNAGFRLPSANR